MGGLGGLERERGRAARSRDSVLNIGLVRIVVRHLVRGLCEDGITGKVCGPMRVRVIELFGGLW